MTSMKNNINPLTITIKADTRPFKEKMNLLANLKSELLESGVQNAILKSFDFALKNGIKDRSIITCNRLTADKTGGAIKNNEIISIFDIDLAGFIENWLEKQKGLIND